MMAFTYKNDSGKLRTYGRIKSRKLREKQQRLMEDLLPKVSVNIDTTKENQNLNPADFFNNQYEKFYLEIGFGFGEHISQKAGRETNKAFIGCETHENGVARLLEYIDSDDIKNLRIFNGDTRILLENLNNKSLDEIYILFPDPWPKKKHHKRRLISNEFLDLLHTKIKDGGKLVFASDFDKYVEWTEEYIENHKGFRIAKNVRIDTEDDVPSDWIQTRYQTKGFREGRGSTILYIDKI